MGAYSKLHDLTYRELIRHFPEFTIRENMHPDWLISSKGTKLEIDLYVEQIKTAIEIQGEQHFRFIPHFHKTYDDFKDQQRRDREKRDLCDGAGVRLVEIAMSLDLDMFVRELLADKEPDVMQEPIYFEPESRNGKTGRKKRAPRLSVMRSAHFRKWLKRKRMIAKGLLPPTDPGLLSHSMPGSQRQRIRAKRLLSCKDLGDGTWSVWGGRGLHVTTENKCDCQSYADNGICSHMIRIQIQKGMNWFSPSMARN